MPQRPPQSPEGHHNPSAIRARIADLESRLAALEAEREELESTLDELRRQLVMSQAPEKPERAPTGSAVAPTTADAKVALFGSLFAGREDVYPRLWTSSRTGRSGYSPACDNEWVRGICEKPRVKCGECPHQAFPPVTDRVLLDHLQGRHVLGVYPMLEDETCRFLAMDFDKRSWKEDVRALVATCRELDVPAAVERSRSGEGAHVWFFFCDTVAAATARQMGCHLLTETMSRRPELPMSSYDRLFPNQDTMPRGGFGNLIALPLQYHARQQGNTVFLDDDFEPQPDQWAHLASVPRMSAEQVGKLAREAAASEQVLGVQMAEGGEGETPWAHPTLRRQRLIRIRGPLPEVVHAVRAQQLFVDKRVLPPGLISAIQRLAAFQNPEFYKKQAMRLSTALTPRIIHCAEDLPEHVGLPRGCEPALRELLESHGVELTLEDERTAGRSLDLSFHGQLTDMQQEAFEALHAHEMGVFVAPPGTGKTVVAARLVAARGCSTLVLVHRTQLLEQWKAQLGLFLDQKPKAIGQLGGGKRRLTGKLDVAMLQSLMRREELAELVADYGHVIVDECHHVPAVSFERVLREARARWVTGLTATPQRRDGHHPILGFQLGPVRFAVDPRSQASERPFEHRLVVRETNFRLDGPPDVGIQEIYGQLSRDETRNELILRDVLQALEEGRSPVLLTERREHLEALARRLEGRVSNLHVLSGGMRAKQRRAVLDDLSRSAEDEGRLLLATGRFIGEGFDDARLDTLFLSMPVSWKGTLVQYAGRIHRSHRAKREVRIYDYLDRQVPMLARMFEKRMRGYRAMGYGGSAGPLDE